MDYPALRRTRPLASNAGPVSVRPPPANTSVSTYELAIFTRQFVTMFDAGVQLANALDFFAISDKTALADIIREVAQGVQGGQTLSQAMRKYPRVFPPVYLSLVRTGEQSGLISLVLRKLAVMLERESAFQRKLTSALVYPGFLLAMSGVFALVFMYFILPNMAPMYANIPGGLPWPTRVLLGLSWLLRQPLLFGGGALLVWLVWHFTPRFLRWLEARDGPGYTLDALVLKIPLIGPAVLNGLTSQILFTLSTLMEAGMPLLSGVILAGQASGNRLLAAQLRAASEEMKNGVPIAAALASQTCLPKGAVQMLAAGEESGKPSEMARHVAAVYEEAYEASIATCTAMLEPLLMVFMGLVSGFMVLAAVLPIAHLLESL